MRFRANNDLCIIVYRIFKEDFMEYKYNLYEGQKEPAESEDEENDYDDTNYDTD